MLSKNTIKVCGGTVSGESLDAVANSFCKGAQGFKLKAIDERRVTFVDSASREVRLYLSVDPAESEEGKRVLAEYRAQKEKQRAIYAQQEEIMQEKRNALMEMAESIGLDAAIEKLSRGQ